MVESARRRGRQPYPSAPLRFVAFEIRFGFVPALATQEVRAAVYDKLRERYPVADAQPALQLPAMAIGAALPVAGPDLVMINRERTRSITVGANAFTLQTTRFADSDELLASIDEGLRALEAIEVPAISRIGLRFIDEIRIQGVDRAEQWEPYLSADILGPIRFGARFGVQSAETQLILRLDDDVQGVVRFGPRTGFAVDPRGRLRLPDVDHEGQFFLLDIDVAWRPPAHALVPLVREEVASVYWRLDEPSHLLFESAITDRARDVFRREHA
jgi:uncharacterized protein (TIGR04255 family)